MTEIVRRLCTGKYSKATYLMLFFCLICSLFAVSLFKNISYPLFWADESMTVMHGKRVLEYGYPKVHDVKNVLYDLSHPNPTLGIDEKTDAFIGGANWGQYYVAAIGVKLAEMSDDLYAKTGIIRSLFALIGLAGLAIFAFLGSQFFDSRLSKTGFLVLFAFLELISVSLVLHLREARYYSITVFLVAITVFFYARYRTLNRTRYTSFFPSLTVSLFLLFFTFSPAYFILLASIFLFESSTLTRNFIFSKHKQSGKPTPKELFRDYLKVMLPLVLSLLAASPLISFFRMFHIGEEMARANALAANTDSLHMYLDNLSIIWRYIASFDFAYLAIALKAGILGCFALKMFDKRPHTFDVSKMTFSNFLTVLFIVYFFAIAKIPNLLFTRYFIPLQPVLALIIILDSAVIYDFISHWQSAFAHYFRGTLIFLCLGFVLFNVSNNWQYIEGHAYELTHQYKGPLDYVIPFIKEKYVTTDNLIIATNYEETSFMYYLDAKVIVGYIGNNLDNDSRATPDIIFFRKKVSSKFADVFFDFLRRGRYLKISFPAMDLPPNNFPELNLAPPVMHRFLTMEANSEELQVEIYRRM